MVSAPVIAPMLARSVQVVPDQPDDGEPAWDYEPKWDGFRAIVHRDGAEVRIDSRNGRPLQRYFPDVVAAVQEALPDRCIVDGEIVVARPHGAVLGGSGGPGAARLDFDMLSQRIHPADSRVRLLAESVPATLVVFDVLAAHGHDLTAHPLAERLAALDSFALHGPRVFASPRTTDPAVAREWFERFEGAGLDGVVAKPLAAPYQPGKRAMVKIKHARTADVVLAGYRLHTTSTAAQPRIGSLLLGLYDAAGALQFVGVTASFTAQRRAALAEELADLVVEPGTDEHARHPWANWADPAADPAATEGKRRPGAQSRWSAGKDLSYTPLRVARVLEVGYDHMEGTRFRHTAQLKRWRPDRDPDSCTFTQLEEPVSYDLAALLPGAPTGPAGAPEPSP